VDAQICAVLEVFEPKAVRLLDVLPLALAFCGFVVFTNLSLTYNTVGFYQVQPAPRPPAHRPRRTPT
jgi:solute carrier family 35 protein E3